MTNFPRGNGLSQLLAATKQANCWQFRQLTRENSQTSIQCVPAEPHRTTLEDERKNSATDYRLHFRDNCFCFFVVVVYVNGCLPTWSPWYRASGDSGQSMGRIAGGGSRTFSQEGCSHASLSEMLDGHGHHNGCGCYHTTVLCDSRSHFFSKSLEHSV